MKRFINLASILALSLLVLALPLVASAQWRDRDDDYYGNNNGRYNRNIRGTIQNLKNRARNFERRTDRINDRRDDRYGRRDDRYDRDDRYGRHDRIEELENLADSFSRATADLEDEYGNGRDMNNSRDEARRVLDIGSRIDSIMSRSGGGRNASNEWGQIRYDLQTLANEYGLDFNNRNRNSRRNGSGDWRNRVPFPLPF